MNYIPHLNKSIRKPVCCFKNCKNKSSRLSFIGSYVCSTHYVYSRKYFMSQLLKYPDLQCILKLPKYRFILHFLKHNIIKDLTLGYISDQYLNKFPPKICTIRSRSKAYNKNKTIECKMCGNICFDYIRFNHFCISCGKILDYYNRNIIKKYKLLDILVVQYPGLKQYLSIDI
jgi:hypothetical protein